MNKSKATPKKIIKATGTILASVFLAVFFWNWIQPADLITASLWLLAWGAFSFYAYIAMSVFVLFPDISRAIREEQDPLVPDSFLKEIPPSGYKAR
jgi:protein-S-isoprenylcysteine O-methyltransferase Ste14